MKTEQKQQAYNLYFQTNLSQAQICKLLDVDRKTIHNWMTDGNWRQIKKQARHMPSKIVEQFYCMLANLNHEILSRGHQPYPLTHEGEQMRKLAICIRHVKNRQTINESMEAYTHLADVISYSDPDLACKLRPHIQNYIKERAGVKFIDCVSEDYQCDPRLGELFDYEIRPFDPETEDPATTSEGPAVDTPTPIPSAPLPTIATTPQPLPDAEPIPTVINSNPETTPIAIWTNPDSDAPMPTTNPLQPDPPKPITATASPQRSDDPNQLLTTPQPITHHTPESIPIAA